MIDEKALNPDLWFKVVEIEVNSRCNLRCKYCPNSILPPPDVPEYMSDKIFERIIDELVRINFAGKISYHFYGEPLLRDDLDKLILQVKKRLPEVFQLLYTNGTLLNDKRYRSLIESGIDHFKITKHDYNPIADRSKQTVLFPKDLILRNRGGTLSKLKKPLGIPCYASSEVLIVTVTGDILLCCNDVRRKNVMGNVFKQPLSEIWFSKKFKEIRTFLEKGNRKEAPLICKYCDDTEYYAPGES